MKVLQDYVLPEKKSLNAHKELSIFFFKVVFHKLNNNRESPHYGQRMYKFMYSFDLEQEREDLKMGKPMAHYSTYHGVKKMENYILKNNSDIYEVAIFRNGFRQPLGRFTEAPIPRNVQEAKAVVEKIESDPHYNPHKILKDLDNLEPAAIPTEDTVRQNPPPNLSEILNMLELYPDLQALSYDEKKVLAEMYHSDQTAFMQKVNTLTNYQEPAINNIDDLLDQYPDLFRLSEAQLGELLALRNENKVAFAERKIELLKSVKKNEKAKNNETGT